MFRVPSTRLRGQELFTALLFCYIFLTLASGVGHAQTPPPPPPPPPEESNAAPAPTTPGQPPTAPAPPTGTTPTPSSAPAGGGRYLLLPDISFNGIFLGHLSNDHRDTTRDRFRLNQAEIGIQSYVYPGTRLDTFIVFGGEGDTNVEEAFLTFQNVSLLRQQMSAVLGRRKVPFGRVNQLHPHSWLYTVQPYVLSDLLSLESLTGDGGYLSYLLPTGKVFAQLDIGTWSQSEQTEQIIIPTKPGSVIFSSPGAGFEDKFSTGRLLLAHEIWGGSTELGGSVAYGHGAAYDLPDGSGTVRPDILLSGADFTYRRASVGTKRLLLRGEYLQHHQKDHTYRNTASGYYLLADQRLDPFRSVGVRYDSSQFPYAPGRETGISLIGTQQLTEATLYRVQLIHGDRPGKRNVNEIHFEFIVGAGPHTHNLE